MAFFAWAAKDACDSSATKKRDEIKSNPTLKAGSFLVTEEKKSAIGMVEASIVEISRPSTYHIRKLCTFTGSHAK